MDRKTLRLALSLAAPALAIYLALLWQPARQVRLHQEHFLQAVAKRKWADVGQFIGADYHDRWGHDKENVLAQAAQVFGQFVFCDFQSEERSLTLADGTGTVIARLTLGGTGGPVAEYAKQRVSTLTEPFTFKWVRRSWKPWDWELTEIDQPQLQISEMTL
jgi:hypothetical protein